MLSKRQCVTVCNGTLERWNKQGGGSDWMIITNKNFEIFLAMMTEYYIIILINVIIIIAAFSYFDLENKP